MTKNQIFNMLYNLSGYSFNEPAFIELLEKQGFIATSSKIRSWRRSSIDNQNYRAVPDFVLEVLFEEFFKAKRANGDVLTLPFIEPLTKNEENQ